MIWENDDFMAFLDIFPVVPGAAVVIPKKHYDSYVKKVDLDVVCELMEVCQEVMGLLDKKLEDNIQTKLIFEGLEVSHLHAKLWPMYPGVAEKAPEKPVPQDELAKIAKKITE